MSAERTTRRPPALAAIARAQLRLILARRPRGMMIALAIVAAQLLAAASSGVLFGVSISSGDQPTRVMWSKVSDFADGLDFALDEGAAAVALAGIASFLWAFFWPFRVWREEPPQRRGYHWAMPVERRTHDLARTGAGLAILLIVVALFAGLAAGVAALFGHASVFTRWGPLFWLNLLAAPPVVYLLVSIPVLGSRHPGAWLWGTLGAAAALFSLLHGLGLVGLMGPMVNLLLGRFGLFTTLTGPLVSEIAGHGSHPAAPWALAWLGWLAVATTGVWLAATRRHRSI